MRTKLKKVGKFLIKLVVSLFFIYLILQKVNWQEALVYLKRVTPGNLVVYVVIILAAMVISAIKWRMLAVFKGFHGSFMKYFKLYLTGAFINNFVPSTIGGDVFRAYQIGKEEKRYFESTAAVVVDRFTGLISLMVMAPIFALLNFERVKSSPVILALSLAMAGLLVAFLLFLWMRKYAWMKKIAGYLPEKVKVFLRELNSFHNDPKIFLQAMGYSFAFNLFGVALANYILFWSLSVPVNLFDYLSVIFLISVISSIPAGVGLKEWSYITLFGFWGINPAAVAMVAILNRFLQALVNLVALPIYLKNKKD
ncbi:flippase-like domain-containing protein [Patescibacteria group bacterium]|nr:MAG: flippase-like domain-containing protein [Patescibacteria group bacterium]